MPTALFVGGEEGYWGEECVEPLTTLDDAGFEITATTPSGNPPVIDEISIDPDEVGEETAERESGAVAGAEESASCAGHSQRSNAPR